MAPTYLNGTDDGKSLYGVEGTSTQPNGVGVQGTSTEGHGVYGTSGGYRKAGIYGTATKSESFAILGESSSGSCTLLGQNSGGTTIAPSDSGGVGVWGDSSSGPGVSGTSGSDDGVFGQGSNGVHGRSSSATGCGVKGENISAPSGVIDTSTGNGVSGTTTCQGGAGVRGQNLSGKGGAGVYGLVGTAPASPPVTLPPPLNVGVAGFNYAGGTGVSGLCDTGTGVTGTSGTGDGVFGSSNTGVGVHGQSLTGLAGQFVGNVTVSGTLTTTDVVLTGADCAEEFEVAGGEVGPGTVVVIANDDGILRACASEYEKCVAGVISGAGGLRPAIVLDRQDPTRGRMSVALVGKVFCNVDASYAPIAVGDLLTTSATPGHAMRATDATRAFGAVIGKALRPLEQGRGMIPILVALQ